MLKTVKLMTVHELEQLHTGSLLTRLKNLRALDECFETSDWSPEEWADAEASGVIAFKDAPSWRDAYSDVKKYSPNGNICLGRAKRTADWLRFKNNIARQLVSNLPVIDHCE